MKRLKRYIKIILTIMIIVLGILIYSQTNDLGILARYSKFYLGLCIMSWVWLGIGQFLALIKLWSH